MWKPFVFGTVVMFVWEASSDDLWMHQAKDEHQDPGHYDVSWRQCLQQTRRLIHHHKGLANQLRNLSRYRSSVNPTPSDRIPNKSADIMSVVNLLLIFRLTQRTSIVGKTRFGFDSFKAIFRKTQIRFSSILQCTRTINKTSYPWHCRSLYF